MTEEMKKAAIDALKFQADICSDEGPSFPHALHYLPSGKLDMIAFDSSFMASIPEKNKLSQVLLAKLLKDGGVLAFVSDGWQAQLPPGKKRSELPDNVGQWPAEYRRECLMCFVNQVGQRGVYVNQPYTRKSKSEIVLSEIEWDYPQTSARFLFDLRQPALDNALMDAMFKIPGASNKIH